MERAPLTEEQFRRLWATAPSIDDIGRQADISRDMVYTMAKRYGLPDRPRGVRPPKKVDVPLLLRLWSQPLEIREIAEALGVGESFVGKLARRYKLPKRATQKVTDNGMRVDDPTPEEIAERAAWCRARRQEVAERERVEIKAYHYDSHTGLFTGIDAWVA
jgi:transposase